MRFIRVVGLGFCFCVSLCAGDGNASAGVGQEAEAGKREGGAGGVGMDGRARGVGESPGTEFLNASECSPSRDRVSRVPASHNHRLPPLT